MLPRRPLSVQSGPAHKRQPSASAKPASKTTESNIQVVLRNRKLFAAEAEQTLVAKTNPIRGHSVTLTDPAPLLPSASTATLPPPTTKTYHFGEERCDPHGNSIPGGNVFGPEATQGMLFDEIIRPFLKEVLSGLNCTVFAYGQTGTGKTYTMEGNLSSIGGTFHSQAGIIPRALYSLFNKLEEDGSEFSVKCSYLELYNEELRDLNALELGDNSASSATASTSASASNSSSSSASGSATATVHQPLDQQFAKSTSNGQVATNVTANVAANGGVVLRMYEDKTGVNIAGLNETFVNNAEEGLAVLQRGSIRRQTAATRCNEQSSRSHSIFTITVHVKEINSKTGEEMIKIGKLNLVDLAGSENIGKSGAEKGRAKEAGMINVSLLALGRVINMLVQKQSHIPYRESKLTRLLQDSLGGRTKTCIIATISPVNYEETISTLDYALRAKSIQNRPEVNMRMVKGALLSQYSSEIEGLKADLVASREKNGIYLSPETWSKLSAEQISTTQQLSSLRDSNSLLLSELSSTKDQFEQNMRLLSAREGELERLRGDLEREKQGRIEAGRREREEREGWEVERLGRERECALKERAETERDEARNDVTLLREKLERKSSVETNNSETVKLARKDLTTKINQLILNHNDLTTARKAFSTNIGNKLKEFAERESEELSANDDFISTLLSTLTAKSTSFKSELSTLSGASDLFRAVVQSAREELVDKMELRTRNISGELRARVESIEIGLATFDELTTATIDRLVKPMQELFEQASILFEEEEEILKFSHAEELRSLARKNDQLGSTIANLTSSLHALHTSSTSQNSQLLSLITASFASHATTQAKLRDETIDRISQGLIAQAEREARESESRMERGEMLSAGLERKRAVVQFGLSEVEGEKTESRNTLQEITQGVRTDALRVEEVGESLATDAVSIVEATSAILGTDMTSFEQDSAVSHQQLTDGYLSYEEEATSALRAVQADLLSTKEDIASTVLDISLSVSESQKSTNRFASDSNAVFKSLSESIRQQLGTSLAIDRTTGATPPRRDWPIRANLLAISSVGEGVAPTSGGTVVDTVEDTASKEGRVAKKHYAGQRGVEHKKVSRIGVREPGARLLSERNQ